MDEKYLTPVPFGLNNACSDEEMLKLQEKLWRLLAKQADKYSMGDSSIRVETAEELLRSVCFALHMYLKESKNQASSLAFADLDELFALGIKALEDQVKLGKQLYQIACLSAPEIDNISYYETLRGLRQFFKRYDIRSFAHQIPCSIDYQLCHPVSGDLAGVEYVNEYLRRIIIENRLIRRFDKGLVIRLLKSCSPDYKGLLINLYEPVAANALGLTIVGGNVLSLDITDQNRTQLIKQFEQMPEKEARAFLADAAVRLSGFLGIGGEYAAAYLSQTAIELYPRIKAAVSTHGLEGVFTSIARE